MNRKTSEDEMEENHLNLDFVLSDSWKIFYKYILNLITIFFYDYMVHYQINAPQISQMKM